MRYPANHAWLHRQVTDMVTPKPPTSRACAQQGQTHPMAEKGVVAVLVRCASCFRKFLKDFRNQTVSGNGKVTARYSASMAVFMGALARAF